MNEDLELITSKTFKILVNKKIPSDYIMRVYSDLAFKYHHKHYKELNKIFDELGTPKLFYEKQEKVIYRTVRRYQNEIYNAYVRR